MPNPTIHRNLQSFLKQRSRLGGGRSNYLKSWKKNYEQTPQGRVARLTFFLSLRQGPVSLWSHGIPELRDRKMDDGSSVLEVWNEDVLCLESEEVLLKQHFYDEASNREAPPVICPMCLLQEWVRDQVEREQLDWLQTIFRWQGTREDQIRVIHAGGLFGLFGNKNLSDDDKKAMTTRTGLTQNSAWKESVLARNRWLLTVLDVNNMAAGLQKTSEGSAAGSAVQDLINAELMKDPELGDPYKHPYAIQLQKWPDNAPSDQYKAIRLNTPCTEEVRAALNATPPPIDRDMALPNVALLRSKLEVASQIDIPWDDIFAPALEYADKDGNVTLPDEFEQAADDEDGGPAPEVSGAAPGIGGGAGVPEVSGDVASEPCEQCGTPFPVTESTCPTCGKEYPMDDDAPAAEQPAAPAPAAAAPKAKATKPAAAKPAAAKPAAAPPPAASKAPKRGRKAPF